MKSNVAGKIMNRIWGLTLTFNHDENRAYLTTNKQENTKKILF